MPIITMEELVRKAGMSSRPEYYSGRGVKVCDLSGEQLFMIYKGIKENLGERQAEAFVNMIEKLQSLSATNFLNCLYVLEASDWVLMNFEEDDVDIGPDTCGRTTTAIATFAEAFSSSYGDATDYIRNTFFKLIDHPIKNPCPSRGFYFNSYI